MTGSAAVARFPRVDDGEQEPGARLRARRKLLGLNSVTLADIAEVSRTYLSEVESGHNQPSDEWVRRVDLAMDRYEHETGQDEPPAEPSAPSVIRFVVEGVYGAKALVVEGPVENIAELEAAVDRIMRRLQGESQSTD